MDIQDIRDTVEMIRKVFSEFSLDKIRADIEDSIEEFGIRVKYSDMSSLEDKDNISGYVLSVDGKPVIVINKNEPLTRRRFTMAHELGHVFLHWQWLPGDNLDDNIVEVSYRKKELSEDERRKEREANQFAVEFLSPINEVRALIDKQNSDFEAEEIIEMIARKFKISKQMAAIRYGEAMG